MNATHAVLAAAITSMLAGGLLSSAANAGGDAPAPANWAGLYIGAHVGYGSEDTTWTHKDINPFSATNGGGPIVLPGETFSSDGAIGGGQFGANFQFNQLVAGVEVSYAAADLTNAHAISPGVFNQPATSSVESSIESIFTATGRLGVTVGSQGLIYVKGGYAGGHINYKGTDTSGFGYSFENSSWANGWTIGGGGEYKITSALSVAVEYAHIELTTNNAGATIAPLPTFPAIIDVKNEIDTVTLRLNFKP